MKSVLRYLVLGTALLATLLSVSACFPLMAGGVVMTGFVAVDRRTSGAMLEDQAIEVKTSTRIRDVLGERVHITVTSYNRKVLLTGEAPDAKDKEQAGEIAKNIDNVSSVWNEVGVTSITTLTERTNDLVAAGRIKADLIDAKDLFSNAYKIVVERGAVYVMGRITAREAKRVSSVISGVTGVKKVVLVHETITEDELANLNAKPAH
jgi:osmotically-inducible protein OsmY